MILKLGVSFTLTIQHVWLMMTILMMTLMKNTAAKTI
jgi:hypothetical protein